MIDELDARLHRIGQHHFRAKFRLRRRVRAVVDLRGIRTVRWILLLGQGMNRHRCLGGVDQERTGLRADSD